MAALACGIAWQAFTPASADIVRLHPSADTALLENFPGNNFGGQAFFNSGTTQNGPRNRGLIEFDIAGSIPFGSVIHSVTLTLEVVGQPKDGDTPSTFELHRMLVNWGEGIGFGSAPSLGSPALPGESDWLHRFAQTPLTWGAPGGLAGVDFATACSGEAYVYGRDFSPYNFLSSPSLVADAQSWLDHPELNSGWMLLSRSEDERFTARRFASREDPFAAPLLEIDFTPVPEPSAVWFALATLSGLLFLRPRRFKFGVHPLGCPDRSPAP
ncbi:MAG: hypothetical protein QOF48_3640 [Verrucomicrobiota bacterium]